MDKNAIKKYAVWARRELISRVMVKAEQYGISKTSTIDANADSVNGHILSAAEKKQRQALIARIAQKDYEQVMEEVAYTWFNRFSALRFMEVNGYLPTRVRVFTDETGAFKPQILSEAIHLDMDGLDMDKVYALKEANRSEELYKYLLITQCNALSAILPGMFQKIEDYTELLFPDKLLREGSVLEQMVTLIPEADWQDQVQIIGWLYQYYNTEPKDKVFADLKKNIKISKENIPAATQLFTPDWIVRYMVENSLGRLWIEGHPSDTLKADWKYYLDEAEQEPDVQTQLAEIRKEYAGIKPEGIRCIDPCMGSGHILVYMFDVLMQIYSAYGYRSRDAVASIVRNNLYGLDIDDRAAQLAYFSVMMKARQYDSRFFARGIAPNVFAICESNRLDPHMVEAFISGDASRKKAIQTIIAELHDAKEYGSILNVTPQDFAALYARVDEMQDEISMFTQPVWEQLLPLIRVAEALAQKYDAVCTNPPYMGSSGMGAKLAAFVKDNYPDTKSDMSTVCMEKTLDMLKPNGYMAMINIPVWMFLSSFEKMRKTMLSNNTIASMLHPGRGIFGSDFGTTTFVIAKQHIAGYKGSYRRLFEKQGEVETIEEREQRFFEERGKFTACQDNFAKIPGAPVAYWVSQNAIDVFDKAISIDTISDFTGSQHKTADNEKYLRYFWEENSLAIKRKEWLFYIKGGEYRKWYGNIDLIIDWNPSAREFYSSNITSNMIKERYWLKEGITYTSLTSASNGFRYLPPIGVFDIKGPSMISVNNMKYCLGFFNSKVANMYLKLLNPTITLQVKDVKNTPLIVDDEGLPVVEKIVAHNIELSQSDWDSFETSWDFQQHPLVRLSRTLWDATSVAASMSYYYGGHPKVSCPLELCYMLWQGECNDRFNKLKYNEEELNRIFVDVYGLQDELTPEVEDKDVTVRRADLKRDVRSLVSYAVGCMFGRYSPDKPGLILAGQSYSERFVYASVPLTGTGVTGGNDATMAQSDCYLRGQEGEELIHCTYAPDKDGILPICDDEYFDDDIVARFVHFVEVVYGTETLEDNLRFIADALYAGSSGSTGSPREVIRSYFVNDFYADHLKIYQKRPIYWLFDSGKKNGFKALIYMHRYAPDTIARLRTDYVHEQQARYRTAIADLERRVANASAAERVKLSKQLTKLQDQADEIRVFEEKIHHLADQMIRIDLDDGVKHNYAIFGDVLAKIK